MGGASVPRPDTTPASQRQPPEFPSLSCSPPSIPHLRATSSSLSCAVLKCGVGTAHAAPPQPGGGGGPPSHNPTAKPLPTARKREENWVQGEGREEREDQGASWAGGTILCHAGLVDVDRLCICRNPENWRAGRGRESPQCKPWSPVNNTVSRGGLATVTRGLWSALNGALITGRPRGSEERATRELSVLSVGFSVNGKRL